MLRVAAVALALALVGLSGSAAAVSEQRADNPQVAVDAAGNAIAVWEFSDGSNHRIQAVVRPAGGPWGARNYISAPGQETTYPQVAVDPAGDAIAVWERLIDSGSRVQFSVQAAVRPAGGPWEPPQDLSPVGPHFGDPQVALDAAGNAMAVWVRSDAEYDVVQAAKRPAGGAWEAPQNVSRATEYASAPDVALSPAGDAVVVWQASPWYHQMETAQAAVRPAGGSWSPPEDISTRGAYLPQVALDAAGNAIAVWSHGGSVQATGRPAGGTWGASETIRSGGGSTEVKLALDPAGNAVAVWWLIADDGLRVQAAERPAAGAWAAPQTLSAADEFSFLPEVAIDAAGNAIAAWVQFAGSSKVVKAAARPAGGAWERPLDISPFPGSSYFPKLAIGANGDAVAVWRLHEDSLALVQAATRQAGGAWENPQELTEPFQLEPLPDCLVPALLGRTLGRARKVIDNTSCLIGRIRRAYSTRVKKGHVLSQRPRTGRIVAPGTRINLVVSRGRR